MNRKVIITANNHIATQSGRKNTAKWYLYFLRDEKNPCFLESYMGWFSSEDLYSSEFHMQFDTQELAIQFAEKNNFQYQIIEKSQKKLKSKSYGENFKDLDYK